MGAAFRRFCAQSCCCCCFETDEPEEKRSLVSETLQFYNREAQKRRDLETNLWSEPRDPSHSERDDDRALYNLLQTRAKTRRGSQEYRRLSVDIQAMRQVRRGVREKWKLILENLGFMAEAETLLTVSTSASYDWMRNAPAARALLQTLHSESSIFNSREAPPERYLFILDRLIYLDVGEDFVAKARRFYPKGNEDEDEEEEPTLSQPLLVSQSRSGEAKVERDVNNDDDSIFIS